MLVRPEAVSGRTADCVLWLGARRPVTAVPTVPAVPVDCREVTREVSGPTTEQRGDRNLSGKANVHS